MENNKEDLIVIVAVYKDRMDTFFGYTPGMASRVGNHIEFPNYEIDELVGIGELMIKGDGYYLAPDAKPVLRAYIEKRMQMQFFSNARTVRNTMERARMNAAIRVFEDAMQPGGNPMVDEDMLCELKAADFQKILDEAIEAGDDAIFA
jgi:hypothetical protein